MKKTIYSVLLTGLLFASCNLNEEPFGQLNIDDAITTPQNALKFRNGIYTGLRSRSAGGYISYTAIQADEFIGVLSNGNRLGVISLGNIDPGTTDLTGAWANPYSGTMQINYYLPLLEDLINNESIDAEDHIQLIRYRGEAKWTRAFNNWYLMDHYCQSYTRIDDPNAPASGIPLVTEFDPTSDYSRYPGRSTLEETFAMIESDLKNAYDDLTTYEKTLSDKALETAIGPNASYLNSYAVLALEARIALLKGDYATAIEKAEAVIANNLYSLAPISTYGYLWVNDQGPELIFVPYGNPAQADYVPATGSIWISEKEENADYVAAANTLAMYDANNDVRYEYFFADRELNVEGSYVWAPTFVKFPGNPDFNIKGTNDIRNLPKPFRLSETYLILAEAAAELGQTSKANDALNHIRQNRIRKYEVVTYQGRELIEEIHKERTRELIGEGFRISDLRRWNQGFSRSIAYDTEYEETPDILVPAGCNVSYAPGDRRFIWPIPKSEMEANPQLEGQQNPGY